MIYLIGGPPRCGKTTLAKALSNKLCISWVSCDTLDAVAKVYIPREQWRQRFPYSTLRREGGARDNDTFYRQHTARKIISVLKREARTTEDAIETVIACEIANGNDMIIEGYHLTPVFVSRMQKKYGKSCIRTVFLVKIDAEQFARDVQKSTTPNDWLLVLTKQQETFTRVGKMVALFSRQIEEMAGKYTYMVFQMDMDFQKNIQRAIKYLV